jgi:hypothetical protein
MRSVYLTPPPGFVSCAAAPEATAGMTMIEAERRRRIIARWVGAILSLDKH